MNSGFALRNNINNNNIKKVYYKLVKCKQSAYVTGPPEFNKISKLTTSWGPASPFSFKTKLRRWLLV